MIKSVVDTHGREHERSREQNIYTRRDHEYVAGTVSLTDQTSKSGQFTIQTFVDAVMLLVEKIPTLMVNDALIVPN